MLVDLFKTLEHRFQPFFGADRRRFFRNFDRKSEQI